jgi:1-acyl-sn-glycerol-3-phosphate acyltransferase
MTGDPIVKYPRRRVVRWVLRFLTGALVRILGRYRVEGLENIPKSGPIIIAANHFHFVDPPLLLASCPRQIEFVAGAVRPNAPGWTNIFPNLWGFIPAFRGGYSRSTLTGARNVLDQGGVLGIFPEGGSWAKFLRPARPGTAYIATLSGAPIVPVSIIGGPELLGKGRARVTVKFHPPLDAPIIILKGQARRAEIDAFGEKLMAVIASALPDARRGKYSEDPAIRAEAEAMSEFPWDEEDALRGS